MRPGVSTRVLSTKDASDFGACFVPWKKETQGHNPAKKRVPTLPPGGVTEPVSEIIDHTVYIV
jgi:hypothetical protein